MLELHREMEVDILLRWYRDAIAGSGMVSPILDDGDYALVDFAQEPVEQLRPNDVAMLINRDFHDDIAFQVRRTDGARDRRIGIKHGIRRADVVSVGIAVT